jgi:hypothetical protein
MPTFLRFSLKSSDSSVFRLSQTIHPQKPHFIRRPRRFVASRLAFMGPQIKLRSINKPSSTDRSPQMNTSFKTLAVIAVAHAAVLAGAFTALQHNANQAMLPIVKAEAIVVTAKAPLIVKAERIEVRATAVAAMPAPTYALLRTQRDVV